MILLAMTREGDFADFPQPAPWRFVRRDPAEGLADAEVVIVDLRQAGDAAAVARIAAAGAAPVLAVVSGHEDPMIGQAAMAGAMDVIVAPVTEAKLSLRLTAILRLTAEAARARAIESVKLEQYAPRPCRTHLVAHRGAFEAAVGQLEEHCTARTALVVMRHRGLLRNLADLGPARTRMLETAMADRLSRALVPAGELLAALGDGIYAHLAIGVAEDAMQARAEAYRAAGARGEPGEFPADAFDLDLTTVAPDTAPLSTRLADAVASFPTDATEPVKP